MLKEIFALTAFLFILSAVVAGTAAVQKMADRQTAKAERIMETANEID